MRVSVEGWSRNHGQTELMAEQLSDSRIQNDVQSYYPDRTTIETDGTDTDPISSIKVTRMISVRLSGEYKFQVRLSKKDVAYLAWAVFFGRPLRDLWRFFSKFEETQRDRDLV